MNIGRCNCGGGFEKILTYYCNLGGLVLHIRCKNCGVFILSIVYYPFVKYEDILSYINYGLR